MQYYGDSHFTPTHLLPKLNSSCSGKTPSQCQSVGLKLHSVKWTFENNDDSDVIYLDSLVRDGIQVICDEVDIKIQDCFMADKQVFVHAVSHLNVKFIGSTFQGNVLPDYVALDTDLLQEVVRV